MQRATATDSQVQLFQGKWVFPDGDCVLPGRIASGTFFCPRRCCGGCGADFQQEGLVWQLAVWAPRGLALMWYMCEAVSPLQHQEPS